MRAARFVSQPTYSGQRLAFGVALLMVAFLGGAGTVLAAKPKITSATTASGTVGITFSYQIISDQAITSYNATGLPALLSVDTTTGFICGTPTVVGTFSVTI